MRSREKYNAWRRGWWAKTKELAGNLTESRVFLEPDVYKWVSDIATEMEERLPIVMGKLLRRLKDVDDEQGSSGSEAALSSPERAADRLLTAGLISNELDQLNAAILGSRFPDDTGSTRMRLVGLVAAVVHEVKMGGKPTASSIGKFTDNHPTQISTLARTLQARGVVDIRHTPSPEKGKTSKTFSIRPDAMSAIDSAHIQATGRPIFGDRAQ